MRPRHLQFAAFLAAVSWYFCAQALAVSAARGLSLRFNLLDWRLLLESLLLLFLVLLGLALLCRVEQRRAPLSLLLGLPRRTTSGQEWAIGAALGWAVAVGSVLPIALARRLDVHLWTSAHAFTLLIVSLLALLAATLADGVGVHGYAFQRLIDAVGPVRATLLMALLAAIGTSLKPAVSGTAIFVSVLFSMLISLCWLRTHAVWLLWGAHFAWAAVSGVLFGLPLGGKTSFASVIDTRALGPLWLTGGSYGPNGAVATVLVLLACLPVLLSATSDYAWNYTRPAIIPAGIEVEVPPPAAHGALETTGQAAPPPLVQILPSTPQSPVVGPAGE